MSLSIDTFLICLAIWHNVSVVPNNSKQRKQWLNLIQRLDVVLIELFEPINTWIDCKIHKQVQNILDRNEAHACIFFFLKDSEDVPKPTMHLGVQDASSVVQKRWKFTCITLLIRQSFSQPCALWYFCILCASFAGLCSIYKKNIYYLNTMRCFAAVAMVTWATCWTFRRRNVAWQN